MKTLYKFLRAGVVSALFVQVGFAQKENVGIGTTKPDQSAILDLSSTNKGLLMPRVSLQQRSSIQNPANGLIVYQTDMISGFYYFDGKDWKSVGGETAQNSVADAFNWGLTGNSGTNSSTNFIGTTDNAPLTFKVNNSVAGYLNPAQGLTFFGPYAGGSLTSISNTAIGNAAMLNNTSSGNSNTAVGEAALRGNTTGSYNIGIGVNTLRSNQIGNYNNAIGVNALYTSTGSNNTAIGGNALYSNTTGEENTAIGGAALNANISGSRNFALGVGALGAKISGDDNLAIGNFAGQNNLTGSKNVFIGLQSGQSETGSEKLYIANSNTITPLVYGDFSAKYIAVGELSVADRAAATSGGYRLLVKGGMITEKIKVATATSVDWSDYVFEEDYKRMPLEDIEKFVKENKHLPNVPSTAEMMTNGNDLGKTDAKLLEKIEELTLYMIEMNKEIKALKVENIILKKAINK